MITYLVPFVAAALLTALAGHSAEITKQRDELLPLLNFEPFVYVLFIGAGLSIALSYRSRIPQVLGSALVVPFSGALTGWGVGLTITELLAAHWNNILVGVSLSALMAAVTLAPVVIVGRVAAFAVEARGRLFPNPLHVWLAHLMSGVLIAGGVVGLWSVYGQPCVPADVFAAAPLWQTRG